MSPHLLNQANKKSEDKNFTSIHFCFFPNSLRHTTRHNISETGNRFPEVPRCPQTPRTLMWTNCTYFGYLLVHFPLKLWLGLKGLSCTFQLRGVLQETPHSMLQLLASEILCYCQHQQPYPFIGTNLFILLLQYFFVRLNMNPMKLIAVGYQTTQISHYILAKYPRLIFFYASETSYKCFNKSTYTLYITQYSFILLNAHKYKKVQVQKDFYSEYFTLIVLACCDVEISHSFQRSQVKKSISWYLM